MNKRDRGNWGEDRALAFLLEKGYTVIERNFRSQHGEIDLIVRNGDRVVFVEVKVVGTYPREDLGRIVGRVKRGRIRETVRAFLARRPEYAAAGLRCDVIMITPGEDGVIHLENAF
jgi:putative endonuclease